MRTNNRSNALLVELLIVVMFFMLAATVLLQLFAASRNQSVRAEKLAAAVSEAQNTAEQLYAAEDPAQTLTALGFAQDGDAWLQDADGWRTLVRCSEEPTEAGMLRRQTVEIQMGEETVLKLPCSRYLEVAP